MHSSKCGVLCKAELFSIKSVDYLSVTSPITLADIHSLSNEYEINVLLRNILNSMQDLN